MTPELVKKVRILAEAAKYDVSCSSSGVSRANKDRGLGNAAGWGICHSFTADGRCVSLLKILLSNYCLYDCAYCVNRRSNDVPRATFDSRELAELTVEFYRRNYIEGLFLSSGVLKNPDYTMERMLAVLRELRRGQRFGGYIHLKTIPGAGRELVRQAGLLADRLSVNIEIPTERNLKMLAPEKDHQSVYRPMELIREGIAENREDRRKYRSTPRFAPAGQSTQVIIGASGERDHQILGLSAELYDSSGLARVYYSGFVPVNDYDDRLPRIKAAPLVRENRLYQADWLLRFYEFRAEEIAGADFPDLDLEMDPKLAWAIRHPEYFPVDVNRDDYRRILRVPGIGLRSAKLIVMSRRRGRLRPEQLKKIGVIMKRASFFITCGARESSGINELGPGRVRSLVLDKKKGRNDPRQLWLPFPEPL
ncbi:MAG: putative DNA modification/repair radical SAM protein [Candidatus Adiutrix sp.]|jgi:putative DNA modification/repair radical SAM protein|nr:putative DNA modification/repair radical SAM protein [Candidatus Adiutrix sp.]